jgi:hypothetical protein
MDHAGKRKKKKSKKKGWRKPSHFGLFWGKRGDMDHPQQKP